MRDLEDRLPDLLHSLADGAEAERITLDPPRAGAALRRAKRRRALTASVAVLGIVALAGVGLAGTRAVLGLDRPGTTIGGAPSPSADASVGVTGPTGPTGETTEPLPDAVAMTRASILTAIEAGDVEALAPLLDPNTFGYNFDDGSDPLPAWRKDPSALDVVPQILRLPPTVKDIEGYGTFYIWPYLVDSDLTNLSEAERDDLASLGFGASEIATMQETFGGYAGPRLSIRVDGLWDSFTHGGD